MDGLEDSISEAQLREWTEFYTLEPWGCEIGFLQTGILAATVANAAPNRKPGSKPADPKDFMPKFGEPRSPARGIDGADLRARMQATFGARLIRKDEEHDNG